MIDENFKAENLLPKINSQLDTLKFLVFFVIQKKTENFRADNLIRRIVRDMLLDLSLHVKFPVSKTRSRVLYQAMAVRERLKMVCLSSDVAIVVSKC